MTWRAISAGSYLEEGAAACIRVVQMGEQVKLRMTCTLQVLKKAAAAKTWSWQRPPEDDDADADAEDAYAAAAAAHAAATVPVPEVPSTVANPSWANGNFQRCATHPDGVNGGSGRGITENNHSTDVESPPPPPPRVCMRIHPEGKSCSDLDTSACSR